MKIIIVTAIWKYFSYLGLTGFGGPLSLVQLMRTHYVEKQKIISGEEFDRVFTLIKAMPGPLAFQMAVFLGNRMAGFGGGLIAGLGLIAPAFIMMLVAAIFYKYLNQNIYITAVLNGFQFSVAAVIIWGLKSFFVQYLKNIYFWVILFLSVGLSWQGKVPEPVIIVGFGLTLVFIHYFKRHLLDITSFVGFVFYDQLHLLFPLMKVFLYAGTFIFGTGLAIIPFLKTELVDKYQWITLQTFNDGVTFGQMTPGPITICATFFGFKLAGLLGAIAATIAILVMPYFHMVTWFPKAFKWLSAQHWIFMFLTGASGAVVGTILYAVYIMNARFVSYQYFWMIFAITAAALIWKPKIPLILLIFFGGLTNLAITLATMNTI